MKRTVLAFVAMAALSPAGAADGKIRVLIIDGQNNHAWQTTTPHMKKWLEACNRFSVDVATTPAKVNAPAKPKPDAPEAAQEKYKADLAKFQDYQASMKKFAPDFSKYDVVVSNYNGDSWSDETNAALQSLLHDGKIGLVIVHAANNSFTGRWKEYDLMIGMGWRGNNYGDRLTTDDSGKEVRVEKGKGPGAGHGPQHPFTVTLRDREHPVVKGMPSEWLHAQDELYHGMRGPIQNVHLIATSFSDKKKGGTGEHEPMIWTVSYGKGRVFHTPMGHAIEAMRCVGFIATLQRGTEWAATGNVTLPLPKEFPTADKTLSVPAK